MNYVCNVQPSLRIFNHRSVGSMKFVVRVEQQQRLPKIKCYIYTFGKLILSFLDNSVESLDENRRFHKTNFTNFPLFF